MKHTNFHIAEIAVECPHEGNIGNQTIKTPNRQERNHMVSHLQISNDNHRKKLKYNLQGLISSALLVFPAGEEIGI